MKYRFAKEVLSGISVRLCSARPPKYSEILEMDHQVREFDMQPTKRCSGPVKELDEYAVYVRHCALSMFRDRGTFIIRSLVVLVVLYSRVRISAVAYSQNLLCASTHGLPGESIPKPVLSFLPRDI